MFSLAYVRCSFCIESIEIDPDTGRVLWFIAKALNDCGGLSLGERVRFFPRDRNPFPPEFSKDIKRAKENCFEVVIGWNEETPFRKGEDGHKYLPPGGLTHWNEKSKHPNCCDEEPKRGWWG